MKSVLATIGAALALLANGVRADNFTITTDDYVPYTIVDGKNVSGVVTDIVAAALKAEYKLAYPFLTAATVDRIVKAYGTDARRWLGKADGWDALGGEIAHGLSCAEVEWMITREWARDAEDILWRRSKLGLLFSEDEVTKLAALLDAGRRAVQSD